MIGLLANWLGISHALARLGVAVIVVAAIVGTVWLIDRNGAERERLRIEREALQGRIDTIEDQKRRQSDVESTDDCGLFRILTGGLFSCPGEG